MSPPFAIPISSSSPTHPPPTTTSSFPSHTPTRHSSRISHSPIRLADWICNFVYFTNVTSAYFAAPLTPFILPFSALSHSNQSLSNFVSHVPQPTSFFKIFFTTLLAMLWLRNLKLFNSITLGILFLYHSDKEPYLINVFTMLKINQMVQFKGISLVYSFDV